MQDMPTGLYRKAKMRRARDGRQTGKVIEFFAMAVTREHVFEALRQCYDPEIPVNIVDLGLIYDVETDEAGGVRIKMTLTSQGCPSAQAIPEQVKQRVGGIADVRDVQVELVWEPAWHPSRISPAARQQLGIDA